MKPGTARMTTNRHANTTVSFQTFINSHTIWINRPVNDASGNYHVMTDIWSVHHYAQSGEEMKKRLEIKDGKLPQKDVKKEVPYEGQPYFLDEYGGIKWVHGKQFAKNTLGLRTRSQNT